ncbi:hypothetical protein JTE90_004610 [Oedothorax gibbosus]|uniref:Serine aminopeptidase S33 domain-containing protein n=1 Tax=Oedothorax gibbosus TaxID=931172 RepID=A0AAV6UKR4_9ARAC|nr:hypothetical protein JTE90_004610 [Oedothorax gibbosus]
MEEQDTSIYERVFQATKPLTHIKKKLPSSSLEKTYDASSMCNSFAIFSSAVGHGKSDGSRAYVEDLHYLVDDSVTHVKKVRETHPQLPLFMCGHSMGGAVSILASLKKELELRGVVLIAPALAANPETAPFFKIFLAKVLSKLAPQCPLSPMDFNLACRDKAKVEEMFKDPLRCKGYVKARPVVSLLQGAEDIFRNADDIQVPFVLLQGDCDKLCHVSGAHKFCEVVKSADKTLKIYPGAYHSLLNEPDGVADDVIEKTTKWLDERV